MERFYIRVEKVDGACEIREGTFSAELHERAVIGRSRQADFRLKDVTVSGRHAEVELTPNGYSVTNLSRNGATFVDGVRLKSGQKVDVEGDEVWLQIGRVLVVVIEGPETVPVSVQLSRPHTTNTAVFLEINTHPFPSVALLGEKVGLFPQALRVLRVLASTPGELFPRDKLLKTMDPDYETKAGGLNLPQNMSYIRGMFATAIEDGLIELSTLENLVEESMGEAPPQGEKALMRVLVQSVRGKGYRLNLPPWAVRVGRGVRGR